MASCSLGGSNIELVKLNFGKTRAVSLQQQNVLRARVGWRRPQFAGMAISGESIKLPQAAISPVVETANTFVKTERPLAEKPIAESEAAINKVRGLGNKKSSGLKSQGGLKETVSSGSPSGPILNISMVKSLVNDICDTVDVVETKAKFGDVSLYVMRKSTEQCEVPALPDPVSAAASSPYMAPVIDVTNVDVPGSNRVVATSLVTFDRPSNSSDEIDSYLNGAPADGLMVLQSPRVGVFRRCRTIKGKRAPPSCMEKQMVKEGQVLCFIEQLGCEIPVESDVSGEVIKILREDGEPVGYADALIIIHPSA